MHGKRQAIGMNTEMTQILELCGKDFVSAIIKMLQQEREDMLEMKGFKIKKRYSKSQQKKEGIKKS